MTNVLDYDGKNALALRASGMKDADIVRIQAALRGQGKSLWCYNEYCYYYGGNLSVAMPLKLTVLADPKPPEEKPKEQPQPTVKPAKPAEKYKLKQWHIDLAKDLEIPYKRMVDIPFVICDEMDLVLARVLSLKYEYKRNTRDIAREMDVTVSTINNRIHKATTDLYSLVMTGTVPATPTGRRRRTYK